MFWSCDHPTSMRGSISGPTFLGHSLLSDLEAPVDTGFENTIYVETVGRISLTGTGHYRFLVAASHIFCFRR